MKTEEEIDKAMMSKSIYESWKHRWCDAFLCGCMGCVNKSGGVDLTKEEWENWVERHPYKKQNPIF